MQHDIASRLQGLLTSCKTKVNRECLHTLRANVVVGVGDQLAFGHKGCASPVKRVFFLFPPSLFPPNNLLACNESLEVLVDLSTRHLSQLHFGIRKRNKHTKMARVHLCLAIILAALCTASAVRGKSPRAKRTPNLMPRLFQVLLLP